jgi:asparagine synthase (glutamine-hydrolysing)
VEVVSHAKIAWELVRQFGLDGLCQLSGQFALALWDADSKRLVLARDRWGARSLYYAKIGGRILFASEYKALLALPEVPARCNREAILYAVRTRHGNPTMSFLEGIEVVPRGSWLALGSDIERAIRFWDIAINIASCSEDQHAAAVRSALLGALRRQIAPLKSVGLALSGGLDSALVLAGLRHLAPGKVIHTFTAGYGPDDSEIIRARAAANYFDTVHHEVIVRPADLPAVLPEAIWYMEDAIGGEEMVYQYIAAREAARYVDNVFTGHKADVQFAGMPRHKLLKLIMLLRPFRKPLEEFFHFTQIRQTPESWAGRLLTELYYLRDWRPFALTVLGSSNSLPCRALPLDAPEPLSEKLRRDILEGSSKLGVTLQLHAAHGLYWNSPFMDPGVIETVFQIPDRLKIRGLRQKHILRRACQGLVPEFILNRKKSLQRFKHDMKLSDVLEELAAALLSPQAVKARGIFDPTEVDALRIRLPGRSYPKEQAYALWSMLLTEQWARLYLDQRGESPIA